MVGLEPLGMVLGSIAPSRMRPGAPSSGTIIRDSLAHGAGTNGLDGNIVLDGTVSEDRGHKT